MVLCDMLGFWCCFLPLFIMVFHVFMSIYADFMLISLIFMSVFMCFWFFSTQHQHIVVWRGRLGLLKLLFGTRLDRGFPGFSSDAARLNRGFPGFSGSAARLGDGI